MSVTIEVPIPDDLIPLLEQKARSAGLPRDEYIRVLISRELRGPRPLDEVLNEFRQEVTASGLSDAELTELFGNARDDARAS
ncbi:MAG: hypothetical protein IPM24_07775 [Bryobacterales bacterium]|nr:hypothetical protein [Bryobacterales bacterium]